MESNQKKSKEIFLFAIIILITLIISVFATWIIIDKKLKETKQELKNEKEFSKTLIAYQSYREYYSADINILQTKYGKANPTLDYNSCLNYNALLREIYVTFQDHEQKNEEYYGTVAKYVNKTSCNDQFEDYKQKSLLAQQARTQYLIKHDDWCYGFFNIAEGESWTSQSWKEKYETPDKQAANIKNLATDALTASETKLIKICFAE